MKFVAENQTQNASGYTGMVPAPLCLFWKINPEKKMGNPVSKEQWPSIMKAKEETEAKEMKPLLNSEWMKVLLAD
jgi:hypothetical protein